jgi:hypothetical protein
MLLLDRLHLYSAQDYRIVVVKSMHDTGDELFRRLQHLCACPPPLVHRIQYIPSWQRVEMEEAWARIKNNSNH